MPIYDFRCRACGHQFEALVRKSEAVACPSCHSRKLERLLSLPIVKTDGTKAKGLRAAQKRDAGLAKDRMHDRLHYEQSHDRHG